jgi:lipase ATG15
MLPASLAWLAALLAHIIPLSTSSSLVTQPPHPLSPQTPPQTLEFELRHLHAVSPAGHVLFATPSQQEVQLHATSFNINVNEQHHTLHTRPVKTYRPGARSFDAFSSRTTHPHQHAFNSYRPNKGVELLRWDEDEVPGPDVTRRDTLLTLAKMTSNAYYPNSTETGWWDLGGNWTFVRHSFIYMPIYFLLNLLPCYVHTLE